MEKLTTRALQAQVEAANVDRENSNKVKQEEGALSVARIKAMARNVRLFVHAIAAHVLKTYRRRKPTPRRTPSSQLQRQKPNAR